MKVLCTASIALALAANAIATDRVVFSSGAPGYMLDMANQSELSPSLLRLGWISGSTTQGGTYPQRWTATPFHVMQADTINKFEVAYYFGSTTPTSFGWAIYKADGTGGAPGTTVTSGTAAFSSVLPVRFIYPNGFAVEYLLDYPITSTNLAAGDYWFTFYGTNGELVWYAGSPGGPDLGYNYRRTDAPSAWAAFQLGANDTAIPNYGMDGLYGATYPTTGPNPNDIYQCTFALLNSSGTGTSISGTISKGVWTYGPGIALPDGSPAVYEMRLRDPGTGALTNLFTFTVASDGSFSLGPVQAGTYDIVVKPVSTYVGRFGLYQSNGTVISQQSTYSGFGDPNLGVQLGGVVVSGTSTSLGTLDMLAGDNTLDGAVNLLDLSTVLANFGINATASPVSEDFRYFLDPNGDRAVDLLDLSVILSNYGSTGPHW